MVSTEHKPITRVWGTPTSKVQGHSPDQGVMEAKSPWSWTLFNISTSSRSGKIVFFSILCSVGAFMGVKY